MVVIERPDSVDIPEVLETGLDPEIVPAWSSERSIETCPESIKFTPELSYIPTLTSKIDDVVVG